LRLQLIALRLVHFALLQDFEGLLLDGRLAGAVAHLRELLLVAGELGIELGEFYVEAFYPRVDLCVSALRGATGSARTLEMALLSVGLGAVLFAPKRRFMAQLVLLQ
jgi:hypothetical protein